MSKYLNDIKNTKVLEVYELYDAFEIVYEKDNIQKSLSIYPKCSLGSMGIGCWFNFSAIALSDENKIISKKLSNIFSIIEINIYSKANNTSKYEDLQIVYKNKQNQT